MCSGAEVGTISETRSWLGVLVINLRYHPHRHHRAAPGQGSRVDAHQQSRHTPSDLAAWRRPVASPTITNNVGGSRFCAWVIVIKVADSERRHNADHMCWKSPQSPRVVGGGPVLEQLWRGRDRIVRVTARQLRPANLDRPRLLQDSVQYVSFGASPQDAQCGGSVPQFASAEPAQLWSALR